MAGAGTPTSLNFSFYPLCMEGAKGDLVKQLISEPTMFCFHSNKMYFLVEVAFQVVSLGCQNRPLYSIVVHRGREIFMPQATASQHLRNESAPRNDNFQGS